MLNKEAENLIKIREGLESIKQLEKQIIDTVMSQMKAAGVTRVDTDFGIFLYNKPSKVRKTDYVKLLVEHKIDKEELDKFSKYSAVRENVKFTKKGVSK